MGGKRYSPFQVASRCPTNHLDISHLQLSGIMITAGIVLATLSAPRNRRPSGLLSTTTSATTSIWAVDNLQYFAGIGLLSFALFLSAWLGLVQEKTYELYGKQWREALFYSVSTLLLSDRYLIGKVPLTK